MSLVPTDPRLFRLPEGDEPEDRAEPARQRQIEPREHFAHRPLRDDAP